jgi:hypothetical protein
MEGYMDQDDRDDLRCSLNVQYGPLINGKQLASLLKFSSMAAFRQALKRGMLPVRVFEIPGRKGKFALTGDVVQWLIDIKSK